MLRRVCVRNENARPHGTHSRTCSTCTLATARRLRIETVTSDGARSRVIASIRVRFLSNTLLSPFLPLPRAKNEQERKIEAENRNKIEREGGGEVEYQSWPRGDFIFWDAVATSGAPRPSALFGITYESTRPRFTPWRYLLSLPSRVARRHAIHANLRAPNLSECSDVAEQCRCRMKRSTIADRSRFFRRQRNRSRRPHGLGTLGRTNPRDYRSRGDRDATLRLHGNFTQVTPRRVASSLSRTFL